MSKLKIMNNRIKYLFYKQFTKGTHRLYIWLTILSLIPILIITLIIFISAIFSPDLNPVGNSNSFFDTFLSQLLAALDPGNFLVFDLVSDSKSQKSLLFIICSLLSLLSGLMVIATLIGIVSSSIENVMLSFKKGNTIVVEKDHLIILGWNDQIFSIIAELETAHENTNPFCVVILSNKEPEFMKDEVENKANLKNLDIVYRSGNVLDIDSLKKLGIKDSKSIIVLTDSNNRDAQAFKISLAINKLTPGHFDFKKNFSVVVAMEDQENIELLNQISNGTITAFNIHLLQSRIIAQCCRQAGLSLVYNDLLDFDGDEIYFYKIDAISNKSHEYFVGKNFYDISGILNNAVLIGVFNNNKCIIQPEFSYIIKDGDELILIQDDDNEPEIVDNIVYQKNLINLNDNPIEKSKNILIINWNSDGSYLLEDLNLYLPDGSNIDIFYSNENTPDIVDQKLLLKNKFFRKFIKTDFINQQTLRNLDIPQYDSIVLLSENIDGSRSLSNSSDAKSIITLLQLRIILSDLKSETPIISQIQDPTTKELIDNEASYDVVVSNQLVGNYTCQLAENSRLKILFDEILQPDGSEFYMRDIVDYIKLNEEVNFYTLGKVANEKNEIAIGYRIKDEEKLSHHGIHINPAKSDLRKFSVGDQLIVLADS